MLSLYSYYILGFPCLGFQYSVKFVYYKVPRQQYVSISTIKLLMTTTVKGTSNRKNSKHTTPGAIEKKGFMLGYNGIMVNKMETTISGLYWEDGNYIGVILG